jgi:8-oxo-dGTP pyrophosphatase MutT (NUDIX family)
MSFFNPKRLSCGVIILNPDREVLLCHVTGQSHWDLPKGGIDTGESPLQAALRETLEETSLRLRADALVDLGRFAYTAKKDLHLFATHLPRIEASGLHCDSHYRDRMSGRQLPEMDGYGWFAFARIAALCTPKMATVLRDRIDLGRVWCDLVAEQPGAEPFMMASGPRTGDGNATALSDDAGLLGRSSLLLPALGCGGLA